MNYQGLMEITKIENSAYNHTRKGKQEQKKSLIF